MRKLLLILSTIFVLSGQANAQSGFEIIPSLGRIYTPAISYQNSSGVINPAMTAGLSLIYHPSPAWGIELNFTDFRPTTYLNDPDDNGVSIYTRSKINVNRLSAGINYSFPVQKFRPYIGCLLGFSQALTSSGYMQTAYNCFSESLQAGAAYYFSDLIGLRLNVCATISPNIPNNSAWFNVVRSGAGFPEFAIGEPSKANMTDWNIGLGLIIRFAKSKR